MKSIIFRTLVFLGFCSLSAQAANREILNVSYDPTRELYTEYNPAFIKHWKEKTGETINIRQSHGGSGKQARSVIDGLRADVVTLALGADVDAIHENGKLLPENWASLLPKNSAPYTSTIVFLVRKGNPKGIKDWGDLIKPEMKVITPNPKTSGGARWNYLAAWAYAEKTFAKNEANVLQFITKLYKNVPVLDSGARGATTTFAQRGMGDVLLTWENEAFLAMKEFGSGKVEIVWPSISILAEPSVAVVEKNVQAKKTRDIAEAYLSYLYSEEAQNIIGKNFYRPRSETARVKYDAQFPKIELVTVDDAFGGWRKAQKLHFSDGGNFDKLYKP